ncbi:MAG: dimethylsulfonioproprionate lyase family protein [Roseovarius sp.]
MSPSPVHHSRPALPLSAQNAGAVAASTDGIAAFDGPTPMHPDALPPASAQILPPAVAPTPPEMSGADIRALFDTALEAARHWHAAYPVQSAFAPWPGALAYAERPAVSVPALAHLTADPGTATEPAALFLRDALLAIAPHAEWRLTYTEEEVGADFLQRFGWFELAGPDGHFLTHELRITVGFWGAGLFYPRHQHEPEELYTVVSGEALFHADGEADARLGSGATRLHLSNQPHALTTEAAPVLTLVYWRGDGLANDPRMTAD